MMMRRKKDSRSKIGEDAIRLFVFFSFVDGLAAIHDILLLPKLVSGEVDVSEVEVEGRLSTRKTIHE